MASQQTEWTRVVVLSPPSPGAVAGGSTSASATLPGGAISAELRAEFARRDWFAVEQHDPFLAMAELCLRDRAQVTRASWGLQRMEQLALVVLGPRDWPLLNDLVAAVGHFVPVATVWTVADGEIVPLGSPAPPRGQAREPVRVARAAVKPAVARGVDRAAAAERPLQLAGGAPAPATTFATGPEVQPAPIPMPTPIPRPAALTIDLDETEAQLSQRVSREEIEMLLHADGSGEPA